MTSFWNLFILFVVINIPFAFVPLAFENSGQFPDIDFDKFNRVDYPDSLKVNYIEDPNAPCGTTNSTTLIGKLCLEGKIQNIDTQSNQTGSDSILPIETVGIGEGVGDWLGQISDFGQLLVFGITLLFSAVTGGFIVQVLTSFLFADELPELFITGVQVLIGLMWLSFFFKHTIGRQLNPAE